MSGHLGVAFFPGNYNLDRLIHGDGTCTICGEDLGSIVYQGSKCSTCFRNLVDNRIPNGEDEE